jgi:hypothetical protein
MRTIRTNSDWQTMERKWLIVGFAWVVGLLLAAAPAWAQKRRPPPPPPNQQQSTNTYAAKFICGVQQDSAITSIPDAQAGRYSTKINVHNNTGLPINFRKKFIKLIGSEGGPELFERATDPQAKIFESLNEDQAMEIVCKDIYEKLKIPVAPGSIPPYIEGFVILEVYFTVSPFRHIVPPPDPLDVVGVYTYKGDLPGTPTIPASGSGVSIEVVLYPAKNNSHILH